MFALTVIITVKVFNFVILKIKNLEVLCTKIEAKSNKEGQAYLLIDLLDIGSGDNFNLMSKNKIKFRKDTYIY